MGTLWSPIFLPLKFNKFLWKDKGYWLVHYLEINSPMEYCQIKLIIKFLFLRFACSSRMRFLSLKMHWDIWTIQCLLNFKLYYLGLFLNWLGYICFQSHKSILENLLPRIFFYIIVLVLYSNFSLVKHKDKFEFFLNI